MAGEDQGAARARIGRILKGKYRLDHVLGVGGMGSVYAATHLRNANRVAVKILHRELLSDATLCERFLREGYAANSVGHPGTVRVLDDDIAEDGAVFLVLELLDGETLDARWERKGRRLDPQETAQLMGQLLDVLAAAHAKGIVHRDIKPENLFLTRERVLRVLDFGVARLLESSVTATRTGGILGTPSFMSPEQCLGKTREVDARSDLWSVGATAFTLLSGRYVHEGETAEEMMVFAASRPAASLATVVRDVPGALVRVVDRALKLDKKERWPDARAMQKAISEVYGSPPRTKQSVTESVDEEAKTRLISSAGAFGTGTEHLPAVAAPKGARAVATQKKEPRAAALAPARPRLRSATTGAMPMVERILRAHRSWTRRLVRATSIAGVAGTLGNVESLQAPAPKRARSQVALLATVGVLGAGAGSLVVVLVGNNHPSRSASAPEKSPSPMASESTPKRAASPVASTTELRTPQPSSVSVEALPPVPTATPGPADAPIAKPVPLPPVLSSASVSDNRGTGARRLSALPAVDEGFVDSLNGWGWADKCWNNIVAGKWDWAKAECDKAMAMNPASPQPRASLLYDEGLIAKAVGNLAEARGDFVESLALRENSDVRASLESLPPVTSSATTIAPTPPTVATPAPHGTPLHCGHCNGDLACKMKCEYGF